MTIKPPSPPYVGPAAHTSAGSNKPVHRIVIHCTVSPCVKGGARSTAAYFRSPGSGGSAHYVVDPGEAVQVVFDSVIAWHAPPNPNSIGIELTDSLVSAAWDKANASRWQDAGHQSMLQHAADLVAQLALAYGVPIVKLSSSDLLAGKHGICGHVDVSQAWHQSTHWDPGAEFPWPAFMAMVKASAKKLQAPTPAPVGPKRLSARDIFHVHGKAYYYEEDSLRGMRLALAKRLGIDFDIQKTKDDVLVVCHGPRLLAHNRLGGFYDPLGQIPQDAVVSELTWDEVSRLRSRDGKKYRISRADVLIPKAVKAGIKVVEPEAKTPYITKADWAGLRAATGDSPRLRVKAFPKFLPSLEHAHQAGFPVIALTHKGQSKLPRSARGWVDYFRGQKPTWV